MVAFNMGDIESKAASSSGLVQSPPVIVAGSEEVCFVYMIDLHKPTHFVVGSTGEMADFTLIAWLYPSSQRLNLIEIAT